MYENRDEPQNHYVTWKKPNMRDLLCDSVCKDCLEINQPIEAESRLVQAEGRTRININGYDGSLGGDENVLKLR